MNAATLPRQVAPPDRLGFVTAAPLEEPAAVTEPAELPPLQLTGDEETDEALALMRATTGRIHDAQDLVAELSQERKRLVLTLRRCRPPVKFRQIAAAAGSTEQTILKIHREARREEAHNAGDHTRCEPENCPFLARVEAERAALEPEQEEQ